MVANGVAPESWSPSGPSPATSLAKTYLTPEAALPGAVFSVWHNVSGALLAAILRRRAGD